MTKGTDFMSLTAELDRWQDAGRIAHFWLRDDDAVEPTPALDDLLLTTQAAGVPLTLAVIPDRTGFALRERLAQSPHASIAVHGWSHTNYAGVGEKKQELGQHRPSAVILAELERGFLRLAGLYESQFVPVLVPPWNRIDAALVPALFVIGFAAVSVYGPEKPGPLPAINTHVDVMDWHGTRGGREAGVLAAEIVTRLRVMFDHGGSMGLLTHHLVHDAAVRDFLDGLFAVTVGHPACRWVALETLMPGLPQSDTVRIRDR